MSNLNVCFFLLAQASSKYSFSLSCVFIRFTSAYLSVNDLRCTPPPQVSLQRAPLPQHTDKPCRGDVLRRRSPEGSAPLVHPPHDGQQPFSVPAHHAGLSWGTELVPGERWAWSRTPVEEWNHSWMLSSITSLLMRINMFGFFVLSEALVSLLLCLVKKCPTVCNTNHFVVLLGAYGVTLSSTGKLFCVFFLLLFIYFPSKTIFSPL